MDLSGYSKLCFTCTITSVRYTYPTASVGILESGSTAFTTYSTTKCVGTTSTTQFNCSLSGINYTYGALSVKLCSYKSDSGSGSVGYADGRIYKIWME